MLLSSIVLYPCQRYTLVASSSKQELLSHLAQRAPPEQRQAEQGTAADCLQPPVRRSSSCNIPIADGKDSEEILGSAAYLSLKE